MYRKRRRRGDHGVDDWLMTYADMITLLLCFFAIFLSVSVPKEEKMEEARQRVMEQFAAPDMVHGKVLPRSHVAGNPQDDLPYDSLPSIIDRFEMGEGQDAGSSVNDGQQNLGESDYLEEEPEGDRITTLEMPSAAFFTSGSAELSDDGKKILREVIDDNLKAEDMSDYQITVEGHTDDVPISTLQFPSNWELSTARAAAVVRFFIEQGIPPQRLQASGYADVLPKVANRDASGKAVPGNQAQNRRVIIKLEKITRAR